MSGFAARFDFLTEGGQVETVSFGPPDEILIASHHDQVRPVLRVAQRAAEEGRYAAGFVAYEAAPAFDAAMRVRPKSDLPLAWFGLFSQPLAEPPPLKAAPYHCSAWHPDTDWAHYAQAIDQIHDAIARGETYQVNHTLRLRARFAGNDLAFYLRLLSANHHGYSAYLDLGDWRILSFSPELFFRRTGDLLTTRPMKGTRPRGRTPEEDSASAAALAWSEKDRAENVMIVDLLRSDLGRIARTGSVQVPELFHIEHYPTTFQMTSMVTAALESGKSLEDIFAALFPCGSVTGAPKIRTMSLIAGLETSPRQAYCGAVGLVKPGGLDACFNVAIRTVLLDTRTGQAEYGVGGGVTWDSTADAEYLEAMSKAAILTTVEPPADFDLLETLRLEDGVYWLLERHLARLSSSAAFFGIPLRLPAIREALTAQAEAAAPGPRRVRLLVSQVGLRRIEDFPLPSPDGASAPVALARIPVDKSDPFLRHKTTRREIYESRLLLGFFDTLLWNEQGELTEFTRGNLVLEQEGQRLTPPLAAGLLPGVFRAELLERGEITERVLTIADLSTATHLWLLNSVRGWIPVILENAVTSEGALS